MWRFRLGQISGRIKDVEGENTESRLVAFAPNGETSYENSSPRA